MKLRSSFFLGLWTAVVFHWVQAERKIVEVAPGTTKSVETNLLQKATPNLNRNNVLERMAQSQVFRFSSVDSLPPVGPSRATRNPALDPKLEKELKEMKEKELKKRNWAIEGAARRNRGESPVDSRREKTDRTRTGLVSERTSSTAELYLQAVDPKYARQRANLDRDLDPNQSEAGLERARHVAERLRQHAYGEDGGDSDASVKRHRLDESGDPSLPEETDSEDSNLNGARTGEAGRISSTDNRFNRNPFGVGSSGSKSGGSSERSAGSASGNETSRDTPRSEIENRYETQRQERLSELTKALEAPSSDTTQAAETRADPEAANLFPTSRGERNADFLKMLSADPAPTPALSGAGKLGGNALGGASTPSTLTGTELGKFGGSSSAATPSSTILARDLQAFGAPSAGGGNSFAPSAPLTFTTPSAPRLSPRPVQLPFPVRGKGGF